MGDAGRAVPPRTDSYLDSQAGARSGTHSPSSPLKGRQDFWDLLHPRVVVGRQEI